MKTTDGCSAGHGVAYLKKWLVARQNQITRAVDFGCGAGTQGEFMRKTLPQLETLVGVDIWPATVRRQQDRTDKIYDKIVLADFRDLLTDGVRGVTGEPWDLWFFGDCLEHIDEDKAFEILELEGPRFIVVRIPVGLYPQDVLDGNKAEQHVWSFMPSMLKRLKRRSVVEGVIATSPYWVKRGCPKTLPIDLDVPRCLDDWRTRYIASLLLG